MDMTSSFQNCLSVQAPHQALTPALRPHLELKYPKSSSPCLGDGLAAPSAVMIQRMPVFDAEAATTLLTNHLHHLFPFAAWLCAFVCEDLSKRGQGVGNVCFL